MPLRCGRRYFVGGVTLPAAQPRTLVCWRDVDRLRNASPPCAGPCATTVGPIFGACFSREQQNSDPSNRKV